MCVYCYTQLCLYTAVCVYNCCVYTAVCGLLVYTRLCVHDWFTLLVCAMFGCPLLFVYTGVCLQHCVRTQLTSVYTALSIKFWANVLCVHRWVCTLLYVHTVCTLPRLYTAGMYTAGVCTAVCTHCMYIAVFIHCWYIHCWCVHCCVYTVVCTLLCVQCFGCTLQFVGSGLSFTFLIAPHIIHFSKHLVSESARLFSSTMK